MMTFASPTCGYAQVTGGGGAGQAVPEVATKAGLDAGPVGDNVNLFTGTLSLSYSFGNVATLSGLSFPLELAYEGSVLQGLDPEHSSGIPYGEGWALANASVTVDGYAWDFIASDTLGHDPVLGRAYGFADVQRRGRCYFANPRLQLPGGGGGRLVYKYPDKADPSVAVYHLDAFDSYIEVRFDGERWVARTDDGTEWVFGLPQYRERNPTNVTAHLDSNAVAPAMPHAEVGRWHLTEIRNANHSNGQRIVLDYVQLGAIDMHPELGQHNVAAFNASWQPDLVQHVWTQYELDSLHTIGIWPMHGPLDTVLVGDTTIVHGLSPARRVTAYREVLLSAVTALDGQGLQQSRAELVYRSWRPEAQPSVSPAMLLRGQFLQFTDPQVVRRDSMYSQKTVWFWGTDAVESRTLYDVNRPAVLNPQQFEGAWRRIMHPRAHQNPLSAHAFQIDQRNPYKFRAVGIPGVATGWYVSRMWALGSQTATRGSVPFTHSVLESPRLDLRETPPGDVYELRTLVKVPDPDFMNADMALDFRVVSGVSQGRAILGGPAAHCPHLQQGAMDWQLAADQLSGPLGYWESGHVVHSTNRDIVKWNPAHAVQGGFVATATPFRLPNLPNEFGGFVVQVGPGSSNLHHGTTSSNNVGYPAFYNNRDGFNHPRDSFDLGFGEWFGTGAPLEPLWREDRYGVPADNLNWVKGPNGRRRNFWYLDNALNYSPQQLAGNGANQPTALTWEALGPLTQSTYNFSVPGLMASAHAPAKDAELWNIELVRIARNPWMLDSVVIRTADNSGLGAGEGVCVAAWKLGYELVQAPVPNNLNPIADPAVVDWAKPYRMVGGDTLFRNVFRLVAVRRLDVDSLGVIAAGNGLGDLTAFGYLADDRNSATVFEGQLLAVVRDPLGGKTTYGYDLAQARRAHVGENPVGLRQDKSWEVVGNGTVTEVRTPIVTKSVEGPSGPVVTNYAFLQPVKFYRGYAIDPHFGYGWNTFQPSGRVWGYAKAVVSKPALTPGGPRARTEYRYLVDSSGHAGKLLLGRLADVREFDAAGALVGRRAMSYAATPAYRNGAHFVPVPLATGYGHQVVTPSNAMWSYEHAFLWNSPARGELMESWFTRLVGERSVDRDPVTGDSVVHVTAHTHFDWNPQQGDPDGDYAEMHRPNLQAPWLQQVDWTGGTIAHPVFNYPPEPSWQPASSTASSSAMPRAWTRTNNYYLWDIEPFITTTQNLPDRHVGSMRPFWLARRHGVRDAMVEQRVTVYDGDPRGKPVALSTYYEWDVFRDVAGDFVMDVDSTNYGQLCDPGGGGPMDPTRHAVATCLVGAGEGEGVERVVVEALDNPLLVQLVDSSWHRFTVAWLGAVSLGEWAAMGEYDSDTLAAMPGCTGGFVSGPDGGVKWFGNLDLGGGGLAPVTDILPAARNYGEETPFDSVTEASRRKASILVFTPHCHPDTLGPSLALWTTSWATRTCDSVHGFGCDSALNAAFAGDVAAVRQGGGMGDSVQRQNFIDWLDWQFSLRAVHQQVDTVANVWLNGDSLYNLGWASPHNVWDTVNTGDYWQSTPYRFVFKPVYPTVCTKRIHARNMLGQAVDESDVRHLHTVYEFAKGQYKYWFDSCGTAHSAVLRPLYGLPLSITVTDFAAVEMVTRFGYQPNRVLSRVVSPNGEVSAMAYDGRNRLVESGLNGVWRSRYVYGGWDGSASGTWNARTGGNFVESRDRIDDQRQVFSRAFADPMGRGVQSFVAVKDIGSGWHKRFVAKSQLDDWGRMVATGRHYDKHNQPNLNYDPVVPGSGVAATASYEASAKSRMLRAARPGNSLNGSHAQVNAYSIIKYQQFASETGVTLAELHALWPGLRPGAGQPSPNVLRIYRTRTVDEDGREMVSYADAIGREVATLGQDVVGGSGAQTRVVTLFARDAQGRVSRVIHPDKLESRSSYNLMGWPYLFTTPDGGTTRLMYNQVGDLRYAQDPNLKAKGAFACSHVDRLGRVFRETEAHLGEVVIGNQVYFPLVYRDTLGIPFRSIHTICDAFELLGSAPTDPNAGMEPWAWNYLELSFPRLEYPEMAAKLVSETRWDFPVDSNVGGYPLVAQLDSNLLHPNVRGQLRAQGPSLALWTTKGRPVVQKVYGEDGELLEISLMDYDSEARLVKLLRQFDPDGISVGHFGRANAISYPLYNLNGSVRQQDVDLGCDGRADFSHLYEYDVWGRLETVSVRHRRGTDKVAKYLYDDGLGLLRGVVHFAAGDSAGNCAVIALPADTILYGYDHQDRLAGIGSRFLDFGLAYDAANVNYLGGAAPVGAAVVRTSQNWGGGINGWRAAYKVGGAGAGAGNTNGNGVGGFGGATVYGFQYDGLNRLVAADASVMEQPFVGPNGWNVAGGFGVPITNTRPAWYGDEKYAYDKVGNLTGLRRYRYYAPGAPTLGAVGDNWTYRYTAGTNRLEQLRTAANPSVNFTYDGNGNLLTDSKKGLTVTRMGRNDLPVEISAGGGATVKYRYGAGGRVYKKVNGVNGYSVEYYLRDAGGAPVAVHSVLDSAWTFQVYGLDLIGEMVLKASGDSVERQAAQDSVVPVSVGSRGSVSLPKRGGTRLIRNVVLGVALGLQQTLGHPRGDGQPPRFMQVLDRVFVPVAVFAVDAVVDVLAAPAEPPMPASPERTTQPDTSSYPGVKFFVKDHLGNVRVAYRAEINDTTCLVRHSVVAVMDYSPYGGLLRAWFAGDAEKWQSTGNERDYESGWDFRGARLYDATYGRFLSRDPMAGMFPSWSPYNYVLGNPVGLTDAGGMEPDGGGEAPLAEDGVPITYLPWVTITAQGKPKPKASCEWCADAARMFRDSDYFTNDPTQSGYRTTGTYEMTWDDAIVLLDVLGMSEIPGISQLADLGSGLISVLKDGDYLTGAFSVAAMLPFIGTSATFGKYANKARKALNASAGSGKLLPGELAVDTYRNLKKGGVSGDNITGHHVPSANHMASKGVPADDALAINMEHPFPGAGGRHRMTFTYGTQADIGMTSRNALAAGVWDMRKIYMNEGLYDAKVIESFQDLIQRNKDEFPLIFGK